MSAGYDAELVSCESSTIRVNDDDENDTVDDSQTTQSWQPYSLPVSEQLDPYHAAEGYDTRNNTVHRQSSTNDTRLDAIGLSVQRLDTQALRRIVAAMLDEQQPARQAVHQAVKRERQKSINVTCVGRNWNEEYQVSYGSSGLCVFFHFTTLPLFATQNLCDS